MDIQVFLTTKAHLPVEKHMRKSEYKRTAKDIIFRRASLSGHKEDYLCQIMAYAYANQPESDGTTIPPDFIQTYNSITHESLRSSRDYLVEELEINAVLIPLRDIGVISNDEYENIRNQRTAVIRRQKIISIVMESEDSTRIHKFLYVLHQTGQDNILNALLRGQILTRTYCDEDLDIELSRSVSTWELPHMTGIVENVQDIADIVGDVFELRLDDSWTGSVVLRLQSISKTKEFPYSREQIEQFLKKMYYDVKIQPGATKSIHLKIQVIPKDQCIERRKPLGRDLHSVKKFNETEEDTCVTCLHEIIRKNGKVLVAEIESDVISETFNKVGDTSAYVQNMCLSTETTPSRQQRALLFLKYVLHEKSYLREFYSIFKRKRSIDLVPVQCSTCSKSKSTSVSDGTSDTRESTLTFILYREDGKNMVISYEDFSTPSSGLSFLTTTDDEKQKNKITRRNLGNLQSGNVIPALDKEQLPSATSMNELLKMNETFHYHRQNSMPDTVMEYVKQITAKVCHLSTEVERLKEIVQDRSEQHV